MAILTSLAADCQQTLKSGDEHNLKQTSKSGDARCRLPANLARSETESQEASDLDMVSQVVAARLDTKIKFPKCAFGGAPFLNLHTIESRSAENDRPETPRKHTELRVWLHAPSPSPMSGRSDHDSAIRYYPGANNSLHRRAYWQFPVMVHD